MAWAIQNKAGKWVGRYRDSQGRKKTLKGQVFSRESQAVRAAAVEEDKQRRSRADSEMTWAEWSETWRSQRRVEASTAHEDDKRITYHVMPRWGHVKLADITRADVKAWAADLLKEHEAGGEKRKPVAKSTANKIISILSKSLSDAEDSEVIEYNPARGVRYEEGDTAPERYLEKDEFRRVVEKLSPRYALDAKFLVYTGMRWGEAVIFANPFYAAKRLDRKKSEVRVREVWDDKTDQIKAYPKGKKRRTVPVPPKLLAEIPTRGAFFLSPQGKWPNLNNFHRALGRAAELAGVEPFRVHDLRHTYATWLLEDGFSLEEVRVLLGHKSVLTTQRYAHLQKVDSSRVFRALA